MGHVEPAMWQGTSGDGLALQVTSRQEQAKSWDPHSYCHKEVRSAHNLCECGGGFFQMEPLMRMKPLDTLIIAETLSRGPVKLCLTLDHGN